MALGVGGVDDVALRRDRADQTLADPHPGVVHRLCRQADGREQFEHFAGAIEVNRTDLRHEVGGDQLGDPVEPLLWRHRLGHDLDQPLEQHP